MFTPKLLFILHNYLSYIKKKTHLFITSVSSLVIVLSISDYKGKEMLRTKSRGERMMGVAWAERQPWSRIKSACVGNPGNCEVKGNNWGTQMSQKSQTSWYLMEKVKALLKMCSSIRSSVRFFSCMGPKTLSSKLVRVTLLYSVKAPSSFSLCCTVTS